MNSGEKQLLGRCREAAENPQYPQRPPARGANPWAAPCRAMSAMPMKSIPSKSSRSISSWVGWWAWVLLGAMGRGQGLLAHRVSNTQWHTRGINTLTTSRTFPSRICPGGRGKGQDLTQGPPQAKDSSRWRSSCARTSWSGLGPCTANVAHWDCGTGRGRTQAPPQSGGCFGMQPSRTSSRAGEHKEFGEVGVRKHCPTEPCPRHHARMPE